MQLVSKLKALPRQQKILLGACIVFLLYTITGFLVLPPIVKSVLSKELSVALDRDTRVLGVTINPFTFSARLKGLTVMDRDEKPLTSIDEIFVNFQLSSLFIRGLSLKALHVRQPYLRIIRSRKDTFNFSDLIPENARPKNENKEKEVSKPFRFSIRNIQITGGTVAFSDSYTNTAHRLDDITVAIPFVSSLPGHALKEITPSFSAKLNGSPLSVTAKSTPFSKSQKTTVDVDVQKLAIPRYLSYAPIPEGLRVSSAFLDTETRLSYERKNGAGPWISVAGRTALYELEVFEDNGDLLLNLPMIEVALKASEPLAQTFHFASVMVRSPQLNVRRLESGTFNFSRLLPKTTAVAPSDNENIEKKLPLVRVDHLEIGGGQILFFDRSLNKPFIATLTPFDFTLDQFSTEPDRQAAYTLAVTTGNGETIEAEGSLSANPLQSEGNIAVKRVALRPYAPYYQNFVTFDIAEGTADAETGYRFHIKESEPVVNLFQANFSLYDLTLEDRANRKAFFILPRFAIENATADTLSRTVFIENLSTEDGFLICRRSKKGRLNLEDLVQMPKSAKGTGAVKEEPQTAKPWQAALKNLAVKNYTVKFNDLQPAEPVNITLDSITLTADNLSTVKDAKGNTAVSMRYNNKGALSVQGPVSIQPLYADLKTEVVGVELRPVQPYITDIARIDITRGNVNARGRLNLSFDKKTGPKLRYRGKVAIRSVASVGRQNRNDFVKWDALDLREMDIRSNPVQINIGQMALTGYYTQLIINPDGTINANRILRREKEKEAPASGKTGVAAKKSQKTPIPVINITNVTLQNGTIHFADRLNKPNFETDLMELGGRISGLSTDKTSRADVLIKGVHESTAPLKISGKINPLIDDPFVDLKLDIRDIRLSPFSPYSGKYIGYIIEKGSLNLELEYTLEENRLLGNNRIFLDQLTLGDKVDSPDATSLPVKLGISLLQDRDGSIALDLPVDGDISDPKFNIGKAVIRVLGNLFTRIISAPFAAIGSMFGGGEELSYIEFDYGSTELTDSAKEKLETITKALYERPSIRLSITGSVDPVMDRDALVKRELENRLKALKWKQMPRKARKSVSPEQVLLSQEERDQYLKKVYKKADFPKPRDEKGRTKQLSPEEMEKLLVTNIEITDDTLRTLANKRGLSAQEYILESKKVAPPRVTILAPRSLSEDAKADDRKSRVNFSLK